MVRKKKPSEKFINYSFKIPPVTLRELRSVQARTLVPVATQIEGRHRAVAEHKRTVKGGDR